MSRGKKFFWHLCLAFIATTIVTYINNVHASSNERATGQGSINAKAWAVGMTWLCSVFSCDPKEYRDLRNASPREYSKLVEIATHVALLVKTRHLEISNIEKMSKEDRAKLTSLLQHCITEVKQLRSLNYVIPSNLRGVLEGKLSDPLHEAKYSNYPVGVTPILMKVDEPVFAAYAQEEREKLEGQYNAKLAEIQDDINQRYEAFKISLEQEKNTRLEAVKQMKVRNFEELEAQLKAEEVSFEEGMKLYGKISTDLTNVSASLDFISKYTTRLLSFTKKVEKINQERQEHFDKLSCSMESKDLYGLQHIIKIRPEWIGSCNEIRSEIKPVCTTDIQASNDVIAEIKASLAEAPKSGIWFEKRAAWYSAELERLEVSVKTSATTCEGADYDLQLSLDKFTTEVAGNDKVITECMETLIKSSLTPAMGSSEHLHGAIVKLKEILELQDILKNVESTVEKCLNDRTSCHHVTGNISSFVLQRIQNIMAAEELLTQNERKAKAAVQSLNLLQPLLTKLKEQGFEMGALNDITKLNRSVLNDKKEVLKLAEVTKDAVNRLKNVSDITGSMMDVVAGLSRGSDPAFNDAALDRYQKELAERLSDGQRYGKELESVIDEQAEVKSKLRVLEKQSGEIRGMGVFGGPSADSELQSLEREISQLKHQDSELGYRATHLSNQLTQAREDVQTLRQGISKCKHHIEQNEKSTKRLNALALDIKKTLLE